VTSNNPVAAAGIGSTLLLHTTTITIDPGAYPGQWWISGGDYLVAFTLTKP